MQRRGAIAGGQSTFSSKVNVDFEREQPGRTIVLSWLCFLGEKRAAHAASLRLFEKSRVSRKCTMGSIRVGRPEYISLEDPTQAKHIDDEWRSFRERVASQAEHTTVLS
jgi:hypothetical protein